MRYDQFTLMAHGEDIVFKDVNRKPKDLTGLEIKISMKVIKTSCRFSTTKNRFAKSGINIPNCVGILLTCMKFLCIK